MCETAEADEAPNIEKIVGWLRQALRRLEPEVLSSESAPGLVTAFAEGERLCAAGRTLAARAVERSGAWREDGERTAAHWMARATGMAVGQAIGALEAAQRLEHLPATASAFRAGELSETRVREVAAAAEAKPSSEAELVQVARTESMASLRETCRRVRAQAAVDEDEGYRRIHAGRYLRHWTEPDGGFRLEARLTPDDGARVMAGIEPHRERILAEARAAGRAESAEAYAADGLVAMALGEGASEAGPRAMVHVRVDHATLLRGHASGEELCEIPGIGPIPVSVAQRLASDAILKAFLCEGADVTAVAHLGRSIPARVRTALEARDPTCVVPECDVRLGLEIDHRVPFVQGGPTALENLARLCKWHHFQKTHCGYRLGGSPGRWTWSGPGPPSESARRRSATRSGERGTARVDGELAGLGLPGGQATQTDG